MSAAPATSTAAAASSSLATSVPSGFQYLLILDFEATCDDGRTPGWDSRKQEIIEFPVLVYNIKTRKVEHTFHEYIRPVLQPTLSGFCTELTGITQETVNAASPFADVWERFKTFITEKLPEDQSTFSFVICGDWDFKTMLPMQLRHAGVVTPSYMTRWLNIKAVFAKHFNLKNRPKGMVSMLNSLKLPLEGRHHSGIDDCKNITRVVDKLVEGGWKP